MLRGWDPTTPQKGRAQRLLHRQDIKYTSSWSSAWDTVRKRRYDVVLNLYVPRSNLITSMKQRPTAWKCFRAGRFDKDSSDRSERYLTLMTQDIREDLSK